jgi:hypothetical protein
MNADRPMLTPIRGKATIAYFLGIWRENSAKLDGQATE